MSTTTEAIQKLKERLRFPSLERIALIFALCSVVVLGFLYCYRYKLIVNFYPLNGSFQTFNPINRLLHGETPGADFNPYLGIGVTYLTGFLTALFGGNFSASQFVINLLHLICHWFNLFVLAYLCNLSVKRSLLMTSSIMTLILCFLITCALAYPIIFQSALIYIELPFIANSNLEYALRELTMPSGSNLGLRSSLPFLVSFVLLLVLPILKQRKRWIPVFLGAIVGILPLWSNDYGVPTCSLLILLSIIYIFKCYSSFKWQGIILLSLASVLSFLLIGSIATHGHITQWIQENFIDVLGDQLWYFNTAKYKAYALQDIFSNYYLYLYSAILIAFCYHSVTVKPFNLKFLLLVFIGLTTLGAGMLSTVGGGSGKPFLRYYFPALLVSYFIIPKCIALAAKAMQPLLKQQILPQPLILWGEHCNQAFSQYKNRAKNAVAFLVIAGLTVAIACSFSYPLLEKPVFPNYFYAAEVGGWFSPNYETPVAKARLLKEKLKNIPPKQKMLSTYASLMDLIVGSENSSGIDYIIHALGAASREKYLKEFRANPPEYITTLREDFTSWEPWVRRTNWWFYREFINQYELVDATFYNFIWQRRQQPQNFTYPEANCRIVPRSKSTVALIITNQTAVNSAVAIDTKHFADIALSYALTIRSSGVPFLGSRGLINAKELVSASSRSLGTLDNRFYGLPPRHADWHIPVEHQLGRTSVIELSGYPTDRALLEVSACHVQLMTPIQTFELNQRRHPKNVTNHVWKNGILTAVDYKPDPNKESAAAFIIEDPISDYVLNPGSIVEFAYSGKRTVVEVRGTEVFVSGSALDPIKDGYPNTILFRLK
jgi:hypothetical protein